MIAAIAPLLSQVIPVAAKALGGLVNQNPNPGDSQVSPAAQLKEQILREQQKFAAERNRDSFER